MRALPDAAKIILVALTGYGSPEDKQKARASGFDYHLTKPVQPEALQVLVARVGSPEAAKSATIH
jgi:CheY-like chemotaxis protein